MKDRAAHDPGAQVRHAPGREPVVEACGAVALAVQALESAGGNEGVVQRFPASAERVLEALVGAGAVAVQREAE